MHEPSVTGPALNYDLFCLKCAYNLRGLSGDPVRCPECGHLNPLGLASIPAPLIAARLVRMETAPAQAVAVMLFGAPLVVIGTLMPGGAAALWPGLLVLAVIVVLLWVWCVLRFKRTCVGKLGWSNLLALYHAVGVGCGGPMIVLPLAFFTNTLKMSTAGTYVVGAVLLVDLAFLAVGLWPTYKRLRRRMDELQREVAIQMLRDESRRWAGRR